MPIAMRACIRPLAPVPFSLILMFLMIGFGLVERPVSVASNALVTGQTLSRQADAFIKEGREQEAAQQYLAAHVQFQKVILGYFESALRQSFSEQRGAPDDDGLMRADALVSDLRNVNLSKLWIVLDPDDRSHQQGLEAERAALFQHFDEFVREDSAAPLDAFLYRLYPEDESGERQMEAVREGRMPPSKRWDRLQRALSP